jgi:hypothetical protein
MKTIWKPFWLLMIMSVILVLGVPALAQTADEVELIGTVEGMTLDTITVNGQEIDATTATLNTELELGTVVEVEGTLGDDGTIAAHEVNPVAENFELGEAEFIGQLESFDSATLVINGQTMNISNAEVQDGITLNGFVRVHAITDDTGTWTARAAEPFTPDDTDDSDDLSDGEFFIVGTLDEIGNGTITVAGQAIAIDETTELDDMLMVGLRMKVRVGIVNNEWVALEIEHADSDNILGDADNDNDNDNSNANANANDNTNNNVNPANAAISEQQAIDIVLAIYPNTRITSIELTEKFGGTLVWEVHTSHGIEVNIDAQIGTILTIERNSNDNANTNANANSTNNGNDNDDNDNDDDNSGSGSGGDDDDDNSGSGSGGDD